MAKVVTETFVDDLDGSTEDVHTYRFGVPHPDIPGRNAVYDIDLSRENYQKLATLLQPYVEAARFVAGTRPRVDNAAVRAWAKEQKILISERGRIPKSVMDAYYAGNPKP